MVQPSVNQEASGPVEPKGNTSVFSLQSSSSSEERIDLDCVAQNRKRRDSAPRAKLVRSQATKHPRLKAALEQYFHEAEQEDEPFSDELVAKIYHAAGGASESEVIACLQHHYNDLGQRPGTAQGPRHRSWFLTLVEDHFNQKRQREESANPVGNAEWADRNNTQEFRKKMDAMTDALEIPQDKTE